jgi:hypothetical protein
VVGAARRLAALAIAAQVGGDHGEVGRQVAGDAVPDRLGLRIAVQQQERRAAAAGDVGDLGPGAGGPAAREALEHRPAPSHSRPGD